MGTVYFDLRTYPFKRAKGMIMLNKQELHNVRNDFSANHIYSLAEYHPDPKVKKHDLEVSHFDGCCFILIHAVHEHVKEKPTQKAKWLLDVVFTFGQRSDFKTSKDAHIHVMVSLETLINVTPA